MSVLARLERKFKQQREQAPPADTSALGVQLQHLIDSAVAEQVADAMERNKPLHVPRTIQAQFDSPPPSSEFPPPTPQRQEPRDMTVLLQRGPDGRAVGASIGKTNFKIERDGAGRAVRMVQTEDQA